MHTSQFLIGAASSGSGKTTFTLGLLRALKNRGLKADQIVGLETTWWLLNGKSV